MDDQKTTISNDFGHSASATFQPNLESGRGVVDDKVSISIFKLKKQGVFKKLRIEAQYGFRSEGIDLQLVRDTETSDWFIKLTKPGLRNRCNTIDLLPTRCHYRGQREWFRCPACSARVAILYRHEDDFKCRKCLGLCYRSQKINYRTIEPTFRAMKQLRDTPTDLRWQMYSGKPTKRAMRYEKLRVKVGVGMDFFSSRYSVTAG